MRTQLLIFLVFTVYCFSQINGDSKHSIEGRGIDRLEKRGILRATDDEVSVAETADKKVVVVPILNPILKLIKEIVRDLTEFLEKLLGVDDVKKNPLGIIADIIQEVIRLLNKLLPKELKLSIISIKITENVIIIKIGQGDVKPEPEEPEPPKPTDPVPPVYPPYYYPPVIYKQPIVYKTPAPAPVYLSKPTYIFVKPNKPDYNSNNYSPNNNYNNGLDSIAY